MSVYGQLARMPYAFQVKVSQIINIAVAATVKVVDPTPTRVYLSIGPTTGAPSYTLIPDSLSGIATGFDILSSGAVQEYWIEKHKVLVPNGWKIKNNSAGVLTINVVEVFYGPASEVSNEG